MTLEIAGLIVAAVFAVLALNAYRDNLKSDASWEQMRRELTPVLNPPQPTYHPMFNPSAFWASTSVSWGVIGGTDSGHTHQIGYIPR